MVTYSKDDMVEAYDKHDIAVMKTVEVVNKAYLGRVEAIIRYAQLNGIQKIGIAHCISVSRAARKLEAILSKQFEVVSVDCKVGRVDRSLLLGEGSGAVCNPVMQATVLNDAETGLNIVMALCMGHDLLFNQHAEAPSTTLTVKDEVYGDPLIGLG